MGGAEHWERSTQGESQLAQAHIPFTSLWASFLESSTDPLLCQGSRTSHHCEPFPLRLCSDKYLFSFLEVEAGKPFCGHCHLSLDHLTSDLALQNLPSLYFPCAYICLWVLYVLLGWALIDVTKDWNFICGYQ